MKWRQEIKKGFDSVFEFIVGPWMAFMQIATAVGGWYVLACQNKAIHVGYVEFSYFGTAVVSIPMFLELIKRGMVHPGAVETMSRAQGRAFTGLIGLGAVPGLLFFLASNQAHGGLVARSMAYSLVAVAVYWTMVRLADAFSDAMMAVLENDRGLRPK